MWKREQILARLFEVLQTVPGVEECCRNRGDLPSDKRPAIQLLDADELADKAAFERHRTAASPNYYQMSPGIYVTLKNKKPDNILVGTELNMFCAAVIKAILTDAPLKVLVGKDDGMRYEGLATDLDEDRTVTGKARIVIIFGYYMSPDEL